MECICILWRYSEGLDYGASVVCSVAAAVVTDNRSHGSNARELHIALKVLKHGRTGPVFQSNWMNMDVKLPVWIFRVDRS